MACSISSIADARIHWAGIPGYLYLGAKRISAADGFVSGGLEGSARIKLERGHLNRYFPVGAFGTDSRDRHEITRVAIARVSTMHGRDIEPGEVIVVGDTPLDVDAAKAVGAISLGVASGRYSVDELRRAGADFVLGSLDEPFPLATDHAET